MKNGAVPDVDIAPLLQMRALPLCLQCAKLRVDHAVSAAVGAHEGDRFDRHRNRLRVCAWHLSACLADERDVRRKALSVEGYFMLGQRPADTAHDSRERHGFPHPGPPEIPEAAHAVKRELEGLEGYVRHGVEHRLRVRVLPNESERQMQIFLSGVSPAHAAVKKLVLQIKQCALHIVGQIDGNEQSHFLAPKSRITIILPLSEAATLSDLHTG